MKKIAVICAILEEPALSQQEFNEIVSNYQGIIRGRMGIPFEKEKIAAVSITVVGTMDQINALTGKLGRLKQVSVKIAVSNKEVSEDVES